MRNFTTYSPEYKEKCFVTWYSNGRPEHLQALVEANKFPQDEHGRVPALKLLKQWRVENGWDLRADDLDVRAITIVEDSLVNQKAQMLQRHAEIGHKLMEAGMAHISSGEFDSSASAVSAVVRGAELERESRGIGELIVKMSKMSEDDLRKEIMERLARASEAGQIIDAEEDVGEVNSTDTNN